MSIEAISVYNVQEESASQAVEQTSASNEKNFSDELAAAMAADYAALEQITYAALLNPMAPTVQSGDKAYGVTDIMSLTRSVNGPSAEMGLRPTESDMARGTREGITYSSSGVPLTWPENDWHPANRGMDHYDIFGGAARVYDFSQSDWDTIEHHRTHNSAWLERFGYTITEIGDDKLLVTKPLVNDSAISDASVDTGLPSTTTQANENVSAYDPPDGPRFLRFI